MLPRNKEEEKKKLQSHEPMRLMPCDVISVPIVSGKITERPTANNRQSGH